MHSEHLRNVQFSWVAFGWFIAVSVAISVILLITGAGLADMDGPGAFWLTVAAAIGWFAGGFITGFKAAAAPILHGVAIALLTFIAWFLLGLLGGPPGGAEVSEALATRAAAGALLVQALAGTAGCWVGYRYTPVRVE